MHDVMITTKSLGSAHCHIIDPFAHFTHISYKLGANHLSHIPGHLQFKF